MTRFLYMLAAIICTVSSFAQTSFTTLFEKSNGIESAAYFDCISYYKKLDAAYTSVKMIAGDTTDAGYPLHCVLVSRDKIFDPAKWHAAGKVVVMINNGIHPGEPDGIDASMMFVRDAAMGKIILPDNVVLAVIPVYNIGGCLNRNSYSRANQNGPVAYGFRGNAENLDLNRDFIKADSKDAFAFEKLFQWLNPDIFIDNHVSDGADYQHTITLITTQHNKLGGAIGEFMHNNFEPALYAGMQAEQWNMCPYVNVDDRDPSQGWEAFYESPRYSSGYAALFSSLSFIVETHMLKPYRDRVYSTYSFEKVITEKASAYAKDIIEKRKQSINDIKQKTIFPISWALDSSEHETINFMGYKADSAISKVTGMKRLFYNHDSPYTKSVKFYNTYKPAVQVNKPVAYIIPQGWNDVIKRLQLNNVKMNRLKKDTTIKVEAYHIEKYESLSRAWEKHHFNYDIQLRTDTMEMKFLQGDYIIYTEQSADRYIVETLEPSGDDSYFAWNFFDAVLQQKEGYSSYRWEDVAAAYLQQHPELQQQLDEKRKTDTSFAHSADAQLNFVYKHSPYYEAAHLRYPVYRVISISR